MTKKELLKFPGRAFAYLGIGAVVATLLLIAVYLLPTEPMMRHVESFTESLPEEGEIVERETFTEAIILQSAAEAIEGKGILEKAMMIYRHDLTQEAWDPEGTLAALTNGADPQGMYLREYSRYWHGYLVLVKPLLLLFDWEQILVIGALVQIALLIGIAILSIKQKKIEVLIAVLAGLAVMKPLVMAASITMMLCSLVSLTTICLMLASQRVRGAYPYLFLTVGMVTSYIDLLTYPIVTLGLPLCVYFLLYKEESWKMCLQKLIVCGASWGIGYGGIWAIKWILCDLTMGQGTIKDAIWTIIGRTESAGGRPFFNGAFYATSLNVAECTPAAQIFFLLLLLATCAVAVWVMVRRRTKEILPDMLIRLLIALIPIAWFAVTQNHSAMHCPFTFRILGVAAASLMASVWLGAEKMLKCR